jgi:hypothetical protein
VIVIPVGNCYEVIERIHGQEVPMLRSALQRW